MNLIDNTGTESLVDVAGVLWTKTQFSSYTTFRSVDGQHVVTQSSKKFWTLSSKNAQGEFDRRQRTGFATAKDAQLAVAA